MYNVFIYLYRLCVMIASHFNEKISKMWLGEHEAFEILRDKVDPNAEYVWFHAASLGEFEQGRPIMERLRQAHPEQKILLTFFSPSGYEVRKDYEGADIVCYLPLDTPTNARHFLRLIRPVKAYFIKYEFWYNYLHILKHREVPTYSVSSIFRPGQIFFRWYGKQYGRVLKCFTTFFVQNEQSRVLLSKLQINNVDVTGDTRFDRVLQIKESAKQLPVVEAFSNQQSVIVAGSTWPPDEDILILFLQSHKEWKLILAPHVIDENHLQQIESKVRKTAILPLTPSSIEGEPVPGDAQTQILKVVRYTQASLESVSQANVLIIDCFGLLSSIYGYGQVAYVGGGFGVGIHNLLEAAVWNVPVFFGPNNQRFREAQELKVCGGGIEISTFEDFEREMLRFISHPDELIKSGEQAGQYVKGNSGATERILKNTL